LEICNGRNIQVIEDATESLGSTYKSKKTGALGVLGCFSFNGNKIITTGGGGMITTNNSDLAKRAKHITTTAKTDPLDYDHDEVGYNYRLVNILAAFGVAQLERINEFVQIKRNNLANYKQLIEPHKSFFIHTEPHHSVSNYWMYSLVLKPGAPYTIPELIRIFESEKIQTRPIWKLMNTLPMFAEFQSYKCEVSVEIRERVLSIPCSTNLQENDILRVVELIKKL
jgi:perosamine synthetase